MKKILIYKTLFFLIITIFATPAAAWNRRCLLRNFKPAQEINIPSLKENQVDMEDTTIIVDYYLNIWKKKQLSFFESVENAVNRADSIISDKYRFGSYPGFELPDDLTWKENPAKTRNWQYFFFSLEAVHILSNAFTISGKETYLEKAETIIQDYIQDNYTMDKLPDQMSWTDHTAANRTIYLINFWNLYLENLEPDKIFILQMLELFWRHGHFLNHPANYSSRSNHGIFSNLALLRLSISFPEFSQSSKWKDEAIKRMKEQIRDNFTDQGVHEEFSPLYHLTVTGLLNLFLKDCEENGIEPDKGLKAVFEKAVDYIPCLYHPDGTLALFGDSDIHAPEKIIKRILPASPQLEFILSKGSSGSRPEFLNRGFSDANIYIMKSGWGDCRNIEDESSLMLYFTNKAKSHDHSDWLNFEFYSKGVKWITDLGRWGYDYEDKKREYITSFRAHNSVVPYIYEQYSEIAEQSEKSQTPKPFIETRIEQILRSRETTYKISSLEKIINVEIPELKDKLLITLANLYAEECNDSLKAAEYLNRIITDGVENEYDVVARQLLSIMEIEPDSICMPVKSEEQEELEKVERNLKFSEIKNDIVDEPETLNWINNQSFQYLEGRIFYRDNEVAHSRAFLFIGSETVLLVDRINSSSAIHCRKYLHLSPDVSVSSGSGHSRFLHSSNSRHCIYFPVSSGEGVEFENLAGIKEPEYLGWYSGVMNNFEQTEVLRESFFLDNEELYSVTLLIPTGSVSPGIYQIETSNPGSWNPKTQGALKIELTGLRTKTEIRYKPSSKFMYDCIDIPDSTSAVEEIPNKPPLIRIRKTRFR